MAKKKQLSGAAKRKKKKEKEDAIAEATADMERLKLGPTKLWTGLVTHHKDIFVSHVLPRLNATDRFFFARVNRASQSALEYAGVNLPVNRWIVFECVSISTLEWMWNTLKWGEKDEKGNAINQPWFCAQVACTNKLEFLKWAREVKKCEWDDVTITMTARKGNLEMLKYTFYNGCPFDKNQSCIQAVFSGSLECVRFLFEKMKVKPSQDVVRTAAVSAAGYGHADILKYFVEERRIYEDVKINCMTNAATYGRLDSLKYLVEEAKVPLITWQVIAYARYYERQDCVNYLQEKGAPEPPETRDEVYDRFVEHQQQMIPLMLERNELDEVQRRRDELAEDFFRWKRSNEEDGDGNINHERHQ
jgi:hypothetical protein